MTPTIITKSKDSWPPANKLVFMWTGPVTILAPFEVFIFAVYKKSGACQEVFGCSDEGLDFGSLHADRFHLNDLIGYQWRIFNPKDLFTGKALLIKREDLEIASKFLLDYLTLASGQGHPAGIPAEQCVKNLTLFLPKLEALLEGTE